MKRLLIALILATVPTVAHAQVASDVLKSNDAADAPTPWTLKLKPQFSVERSDLVGLQFSDARSEGEYSLAYEREFDFGDNFGLTVEPSVSLSPHLFDNQSDTSTVGMSFTLKKQFDVSNFADGLGRRHDLQDSLAPFLSYEAGRSWEGTFTGQHETDQTFKLGATYTDVRRYLCVGDERPRRPDDLPGTNPGCHGKKGLTYAFTLSLAEVVSTSPDNELNGASFEFKGSLPLWATSRLVIEASAEHRRYDSRLADDGLHHAQAGRYSVHVALDLSGYVQRTVPLLSDFEFSIGARWVGVDATREDLDRDEITIIPTFSRKF